MTTAFDSLDTRIQEALRERGFLVSTEPQERTIPLDVFSSHMPSISDRSSLIVATRSANALCW